MNSYGGLEVDHSPLQFISRPLLYRWGEITRTLYPLKSLAPTGNRTTISPSSFMYIGPGTHYPLVTWAYVMLRVQLGCERRFNIGFYGADSHFCHSACHVIARGAMVSSRASTPLTFLLSHTFRETWRRDLRVECSSDVVISLQKRRNTTVRTDSR